jgi:RuvA, C-terminal domain
MSWIFQRVCSMQASGREKS